MQYRRYQAPRDSGVVVCEPPRASLPELLHQNAARLRSYPSTSGVGRLVRDSDSARRELLELAHRHTAAYRDVAVPAWQAAGPPPRFLMTGHQPRLFHPGVWYKNFVLDRLARSLEAVALHLVIDNDLVGGTGIRVPAGSVASPHLETVLLDRPSEEIPFEERAILDRDLFQSFGDRVQHPLRAFLDAPLIGRWWPAVVDAGRRVGNLGQAVAQARHQLEGEWGLQTCELPLSAACETCGFRRFLAAILAELPRFHRVYNECLLEYRRVNRVRSQSHPVPRLDQQDGWWEAPFWIWTAAQPRRKRLFVRQVAAQWELTDRDAIRVALPLHDPERIESAVEQLRELSAAQAIRLRPRALMTTMYLRLLMCDLFLHGIGGGKYDQLTDEIMRRFYGIEPPAFAVLSATLQLPIPLPPVRSDDLHELERQLRELTYNPDRHVSLTERTRPWVEAKHQWLASAAGSGQAARRHAGIHQANTNLQPFVAERRHLLEQRREELVEQLRHRQLLGSREFSFCLFPEATLQSLLLDK